MCPSLDGPISDGPISRNTRPHPLHPNGGAMPSSEEEAWLGRGCRRDVARSSHSHAAFWSRSHARESREIGQPEDRRTRVAPHRPAECPPPPPHAQVKDPSERDRLFGAISAVPCVARKVEIPLPPHPSYSARAHTFYVTSQPPAGTPPHYSDESAEVVLVVVARTHPHARL